MKIEENIECVLVHLCSTDCSGTGTEMKLKFLAFTKLHFSVEVIK